MRVSGTEGYAEAEAVLAGQYESFSFAEAHRQVGHLIPTQPGSVLDIGGGTGRDAAGLAAMGHRVLAVAPTAEFRAFAVALHPSPGIEWLDDALPELRRVLARTEAFDLVMMTAVWMHLDAAERQRAMPNVARLLRPGAPVILSLRYGPVPAGRRMFAVSPEETVELAAAEGLRLVFELSLPGQLAGAPGVSWTRLAFRKPQ